MTNKAIAAIKSLASAGQNGFITVRSGQRPSVLCEFSTLSEAHEFHRALIECGLAARNIKIEEAKKN